MKFSSHFTPLSQVYLIEGNCSAINSELISLLEKDHSIVFQANPDAWVGTFATFAIDDAREIKEMASKKKIGEGKRVFIISAESLTREASNALLKTLEEPSEGTHFFIIVPSAKRILPTILSRVRVVKHDSLARSSITSAEAFLKLSPAERVKKIKDIFVDLEKEVITRADVNALIESVLHHIYEKNQGKNEQKSLEKQALAVSYARDQSASLKMILEYLALTA
jgi:DNA polymerase III delta prime subunit